MRMRHLAEKISILSILSKLLIISIHVLNFSFLTLLLREIWMESFVCHWLNTTGPQKFFFFLGGGSLDGVFDVVWVSGYFWINLTKSWFLRHYGFSPHLISSLPTTLNFTAQKLQL